MILSTFIGLVVESAVLLMFSVLSHVLAMSKVLLTLLFTLAGGEVMAVSAPLDG